MSKAPTYLARAPVWGGWSLDLFILEPSQLPGEHTAS